MRYGIRLSAILAACTISSVGSLADTTPPALLDPTLQVTTVLNSGIVQPIGIVFLGENDFLVLEKASGQVKRVINGVIQPNLVLDLAVNSASERGLLAMALHPNFPATPQVFIRWTESSTGVDTNVTANVQLLGNRVDRFIWNPATGTLTQDINIIRLRALQTDNIPVPGQPPTTANPGLNGNHNGGPILFGPTASCICSSAIRDAAAGCRTCPTDPSRTHPSSTTRLAGPRPTTPTSPASSCG